MEERIQKVLARAGVGSRREVESWIKDGRLKVDNKLATLGQTITGDEKISLDDKPLRIQPNFTPRVLLYHKPVGEICSRSDPEGRPTVFDHLPPAHGSRWISIGRLDFNTSGLLLLTTDGELANRMMHPSYELEREYAVRVNGTVSDQTLQNLLNGVMLEDGMAKFSQIVDAGGEGRNHWYHVILQEGRNREVRRLWEAEGLMVSRLIRVRYGETILPRKLAAGRFIELTEKDVMDLRKDVGLATSEVKTYRKQAKKKTQLRKKRKVKKRT